MNIKIMLNKDEEIKRLAADPEVQIKIKDAIIDGMTRRIIKNCQDEILIQVKQCCRREFETVLEQEGYTYNGWQGCSATEKMCDKIRDTASGILSGAIRRCIDEAFAERSKEVNAMLMKKLAEIERIDATAEIKAAAERVIRNKFGV